MILKTSTCNTTAPLVCTLSTTSWLLVNLNLLCAPVALHTECQISRIQSLLLLYNTRWKITELKWLYKNSVVVLRVRWQHVPTAQISYC